MRTLISDALASELPQPEITVCGWIRSRRDSKEFSFVELNDGSCLANLQCLVDGGTVAFAALADANTGAALEVKGELVPSPGKGQKWELRAKEIKIFGLADPATFPLQKKRHSDEFLRGIAHLRPRTNKYGAMLRVSAEASFAIHEFFHKRRFFWMRTPILTGSDCEGAGEMFRVTTLPAGAKDAGGDFFSKQCNLTVSGQLELEALAMGLGRVYSFGPTFRAENSNTPRHAAEFWMVEPEAAFLDLSGLMDLAEALVKAVVTHVLEACAPDIELFDKFVAKGLKDRLQVLVNEPFGRVSYAQAIEALLKSGAKFEFPVSFGIDLQTEHERYLAEEIFRRPVMVYDYPRDIKAFYMRANEDDSEGRKTVAAMDMLVPHIGELVGGSQREDRLEILEARMRELGQNPEDYWWYLDLRRFGSVPHAGFGLGFERLIMLLTGIANIRDVLPFPRTPGSLEF